MTVVERERERIERLEARLAEAQHRANVLRARYGSLRQAGLAYDHRFGFREGTGQRLLQRVIHASHWPSASALDRLSVMS